MRNDFLRISVGTVVLLLQTIFLFPADPAPGRIPAGFSGRSIDVLGAALDKQFPPKDEFETTPDFVARARRSYFQDLFVVAGAPVFDVYDADQQLMRVDLANIQQVEFRPDFLYTEEKGALVPASLEAGLKCLIHDAGKTKPAYYVEITNTGDLTESRNVIRSYRGSDRPAWRIELALSLEPNAARALMNKLGVLFVCRGERKAATSLPVARRTCRQQTYSCITARLMEIWAYDRRNGGVVQVDTISDPRKFFSEEDYRTTLRQILH